MNFLLGIVCACGSLAFLLIAFRDFGYKAGVKDGYQDGFAAGVREFEDWMRAKETQIDEAQKEIWREEAQP